MDTEYQTTEQQLQADTQKLLNVLRDKQEGAAWKIIVSLQGEKVYATIRKYLDLLEKEIV